MTQGCLEWCWISLMLENQNENYIDLKIRIKCVLGICYLLWNFADLYSVFFFFRPLFLCGGQRWCERWNCRINNSQRHHRRRPKSRILLPHHNRKWFHFYPIRRLVCDCPAPGWAEPVAMVAEQDVQLRMVVWVCKLTR